MMHVSLLFIIFLVLAFPTISIAVVNPIQGNNVGIGTTVNEPQFVKGRLIVKFNDNIDQPVDIVFKEKRLLKSISKAPTGIDGLLSQIKVKAVKPLFSQEAVISKLKSQKKSINIANIKSLHNSEWEALKKKYPKRAKRMSDPKAKPVDLSHIYIIEFDPSIDVLRAAELLKQDPSVVYAQPDYIVRHNAFPQDPPNDPNYKDQWNLKLVKADQVWKKSLGEGVLVAVIDTGVDYNHPDLKDNMWVNPCEDLNHNGKVDDSDFDGKDTACLGEAQGNGFIDDIRGYDFSRCKVESIEGACVQSKEEDNDPILEPLNDEIDSTSKWLNAFVKHGTQIAAIISAKGNNGVDIIGIAPNAKILPIKTEFFFSTLSVKAKAINYAVLNGADIINNSWATGDCPHHFPDYFREILDSAYSIGIVNIFAAGNGGHNIDGCNSAILDPSYRNYDKAIIVGAIDSNRHLAYFSANGENSVDIYSPGQQVPSLLISKNAVNNSGIELIDGTSFSAPMVAGAVALLLANQNDLINRLPYFKPFSNQDIETIIRTTADQGGSMFDSLRILNIEQMLNVTTLLDIDIGLVEEQEININQEDFVLNIPVTVAGSGFKEGQLYYQRKGGFDWVPIGDKHAQVGAYQVSWSIGQLPSDEYTIKYVATPIEGRAFEKHIKIYVQRPFNIAVNPLTLDREEYIRGIQGDDLILSFQKYTLDWSVECGISSYNLSTKIKTNILKETFTDSSAYCARNVQVYPKYIFWDAFVKSENKLRSSYYDSKRRFIKNDLPFEANVIKGNYQHYVVYEKKDYFPESDVKETVLYLYNLSTKQTRLLKKFVNSNWSSNYPSINLGMADNRMIFYDYNDRNKFYDFDFITSKLQERSFVIISADEYINRSFIFDNKFYAYIFKQDPQSRQYLDHHFLAYHLDNGTITEESLDQYGGSLVGSEVIDPNSYWLVKPSPSDKLILFNSLLKKEYLLKDLRYSKKVLLSNFRLVNLYDSKYIELPFSKLTINKTGYKDARDLFEVVSEPKGISCSSQCTASFDKGSSVTISLKKLDGNKGTFDGWPIKECWNKPTCTIKLDKDETLNLKFTEK